LLVSRLIGLYGLSEDTIGNALGWLLWTVQTIIIVLGGLIFSILFSHKNKNKKPVESRAKLAEEDLEAL
jgi:cytochrome c-type biogenesis protein CcmH/NrfF